MVHLLQVLASGTVGDEGLEFRPNSPEKTRVLLKALHQALHSSPDRPGLR